MNPRLSPNEQGLTRSDTPIQAPVDGQLGRLVDQAIAGSQGAEQQLTALLSDPSTVQQMTQPAADRAVRAGNENERAPRAQTQETPSIEQIRALEQMTRQPELTLEQHMALLSQQMARPVEQPLAAPPPGQSPFQLPVGQPSLAPPAQPPPPARPEWVQAFEQLTQAQAQTQQMLQQMMQGPPPPPPRELSERERLQLAHSELVRQGVPTENITRDSLINYLQFQEIQAQNSRIAQLEYEQNARWENLSQHATRIRSSQDLEQRIDAGLSPYKDLVSPDIRALVANGARANVQAGADIETAVRASVQALEGLFRRLQPQPPQNAQDPRTLQRPPPAPPQVQVPAYQGMNPLQVQAAQQAMRGAAMQGNGANRYQPSQGPSLGELDVLWAQLQRQ